MQTIFLISSVQILDNDTESQWANFNVPKFSFYLTES